MSILLSQNSSFVERNEDVGWCYRLAGQLLSSVWKNRNSVGRDQNAGANATHSAFVVDDDLTGRVRFADVSVRVVAHEPASHFNL